MKATVESQKLRPVAENVWVADLPHQMLGLHLGTRMTVVRLPDDGLWLHSPIALTPALKAELDALGPVKHIVCPNLFHHMYAGNAAAAYPGAILHGPKALQRRRKDLRFGGTVSEEAHPDWAGTLQPITIRGSLLFETVFFHPASRTLISSDLVENFQEHPHLPTRLYLKVSGIYGKVGWGKAFRLVYWNRKAARKSIARILELPFERIILAHGDILTRNVHEELRQAFRWL